PGFIVSGSTPWLASFIACVVVPHLAAILEKVSPDSMVYLGPQTPGAPSGAGVGLGAAPPTGVSAFGSRIATSGGLSQGGAVGTLAGSESFPISAFLSSPPPHAAERTSMKQVKIIAGIPSLMKLA